MNGTAPVGSFVKGVGTDRAGEVHVSPSRIFGPSGTTGTILGITDPNR